LKYLLLRGGRVQKENLVPLHFFPTLFTFFLPYDDPNLTKDILATMENKLFLPGKEKR
jgi:hypothetical protein